MLNARAKGAIGEREARDLFRDAGIECNRTIGQTRGGHEAPDLDVDGLWVEVKRGRSHNINAALDQAIRETGASGRLPLALTRKDHAEWLVTCRWSDVDAIFAQLVALKGLKANE